MGAVYEAHLYSNTGQYLIPLPKRLTRLEWNRKVNDVGTFSVTLSDRLHPVDTTLFQKNGRIAIYRKPDPFGVARLEMVGFIRGERFQTDKRGVTQYTWYGQDQNALLADRVCHPMFDAFWAPYFDGYIDTCMRLAVERNNGSTTESALRKITTNSAGLTITTESSATTTSCAAAGRAHFEAGGKSLLRVLQEMYHSSLTYMQPDVGATAAVPVFFDMCPDTHDTFTFRTFANRRGMNHRSDSGNALHIGTRYGNLTEPAWEHDRTNEVNAGLAVYYGMSYSGSEWALDNTRIGEAPLNRREAGVMASEDLLAAATTLINEGKPKPKFTGKIQSTKACQYGLHWGFGDELTIDYLEKQYNVRIMSVKATLYAGRETLEPTMEVLDT